MSTYEWDGIGRSGASDVPMPHYSASGIRVNEGWDCVLTTVRVCLSPRCACGGRMEFTGRHTFMGTRMQQGVRTVNRLEVWRCTRRRWWNWWKHPLGYMLPERR